MTQVKMYIAPEGDDVDVCLNAVLVMPTAQNYYFGNLVEAQQDLSLAGKFHFCVETLWTLYISDGTIMKYKPSRGSRNVVNRLKNK